MPAYRSDSETEIRDAVVERLRRLRPSARIIHELNTAGTGSNRIDVVAVDPAEIIAVEIKSERDKLDRAPDQIAAMRSCAHHVICAFHRKFLVLEECEWVREDLADHVEDGKKYLWRLPPETRDATAWIWPEPKPGEYRHGLDLHSWREPDLTLCQPLPTDALWMLWRDELFALAGQLRTPAGSRPTREMLVNALRWNATGRDITRGVCAALRRRIFTEADNPIEDAA